MCEVWAYSIANYITESDLMGMLMQKTISR